MIVIGGGRRADAVTRQQAACNAGVLASDHVGAFEDIERPQGDIAEIANRRRNKVQARRQGGDVRLPRQSWIARLALAFAGGVGCS